MIYTEEHPVVKACLECFDLAEDWEAWANGNFDYAKDYFKQTLLETLNTNQHEEITFRH